MRPIDYEISEAQDNGLSLYDLCEPDETSNPLMQLLAEEAERAGETLEVYLSH